MRLTMEKILGAPPIEFLKVWEIPYKFCQLAFKRRMVEDQIDHNLKVSGRPMKKQLGWLSFTAMGVGIIVATGIFSFMPYIYATITGPAVIISLLIASATAAISAFIYSEFAVEYPVVGGGFVYVLNTFGEYPAALCATNLLIDYVFGTAAVVRNFSVYFSELIGKDDNIFQKNVGFQEDDIDYLALIIVIILTLASIWSTKLFDEGNMLLQIPHVVLVVVIFCAGFSKADTSFWTPFFPDACPSEGLICPTDGTFLPKEAGCVDSSWGPAGARRVVTGAANIFFVFTGYDVIALGAEEAKSPLSVPLGMLGVVFFVTIIYVLLASSLIMLFPFADLACQPANTQIAGFAYALSERGLEWAKYVVAAGASVGIFTSCGVSLYGLSRIFQVFAREGLIPPVIGSVNGYTFTPILAVAMAGTICGLIAFFTAFETLANMTSIGTLVMYWFVAIAMLYRRYAPDFESVHRHGNRHLEIPFRPSPLKGLSAKVRKLILFAHIVLICGFPIGFAIYWNLSTASTPLIVMAALWFGSTLSLQLLLPIEYLPEKFSVPWYLMPWVPSVSIWANTMLVGGFGASVNDYYRLFGAMAIGSVVYWLYGVPVSYWRFFGEEDSYSDHSESELDDPMEDGKPVDA